MSQDKTKLATPKPAPAAAPVPAVPATPPAIPLTPANRALFQDLYNTLQAEIEGTNDATAINTLMDQRDIVKQILDMNDTYAIKHNTDVFNELLGQLKLANKSLTLLKQQIQAVATHIATAATIITAIDKLIAVIPTF